MIPGICQKRGYTYRRFTIRDVHGRRKDVYIPLPDPADPRFAAELARVNAAHGDGRATRPGPLPGSFGALALEFRSALVQGWTKKKRRPGARSLSPATLANYRRYIDLIESGRLSFTSPKTGRTTPVRDLDVATMRTAHVYILRDAMADTPGAANNFLNVLKLMLTFAAQRDWRSDNPAADISPLPLGEHDPLAGRGAAGHIGRGVPDAAPGDCQRALLGPAHRRRSPDPTWMDEGRHIGTDTRENRHRYCRARASLVAR
jgi:hypothetical protein